LQRQEQQRQQTEQTTYSYFHGQLQQKEERKAQDSEVFFDRKVDLVTTGLQPRYSKYLREISRDNALVICDYMMALKSEINPSVNYRKTTIQLLVQLKYMPERSWI
jgi:hypothetical protein